MTEKPRIYTYYIIVVLALVTAAVSARAQEPADSVSQLRQDKLSEASRQAMGIDFDPFDYRLQNRHLERGVAFVSDSVLRSSHLAVNLFSGLPIHAVQYDRGAGRFSQLDFGRQFGMGVQYDLSRLHGLRLSYANTSYRRNPEVNGTLTVNEVQAGYLFNLTNYFRGFDPKRRFGVQATLGAAAGLVSDGSARSLTVRADMGLLFRYRVLRHLSLFAEPYLGVAADNYDLHGGVHGYDFVSGVRAGVQLETSFANDLRDHIASHRTDLYKPARWFQNFYVGTSAGRSFSNAPAMSGEKNRIFDAHVYLGYRLGPVQSLRLMTTYYRTPEGLERNHFTMGELDYMLDFTNLWSGYQPQRRFRMGGFLGMGVRYIDTNNGQTPTRREQFPDKTALFGTAGLDFRYNFTPQLSVYVEPYGALAYRGTQGAATTLFGGVRGGFQVDFLDTHIYTPRRAATESDREAGRSWRRRAWNHWFVQGGGGLDFQHEEHGEARNFLLGTVGIGYRFTPVQAVRLQAGAFNAPKQFEHQRTRLLGAVDYMLNLSNLFNGYRPDRRVNVIGFAGVGMRYLKFNDNDLERLAWMGRAGLDVAVRVHKGVSVYAEPFVGLARQRQQGQRYYTFDYGATAGLAVDLEDAHYYGRRMPGCETVEDWPTRPWQRMYVMTGAGLKGSLTSATAVDRFYPFSGSLGYRFSPNESLRGRLTFNKSPRQSGVPSYIEGQIDYVLNVSNLLYGVRPERRFSLSGFAGAGLRRFSGSGSSDGRWGPKVDAGLDLALRIKRGLSVYVEPSVAVASDPRSKDMALSLGADAGLALTFDDLTYYRARVGGHPELWKSPTAERLFFGAMGGYQHTQEQSDEHSFPLTVLAGYQFSPVHALRARFAYTLSDENIAKRQKFSLGVDYLFSLRNLIGGYRPNARFDLLGVAGVGLRRMELSTSAKDRPSCWRPTATAGLDFRYRLTRNMSVFAEPYVGLVQSAHDRGQWQGMAGVNAGLVFDLHDIGQPYGPDSVRVSHTPFFETAHGWTFANGGGFKAGGLSLDGRMGLWLDPVFGLRFGLAAQHFYYCDGDGAMSGGKVAALLAKGRAELLLNPLNARADWRRKAARRRFDLNLSAGLEAGTASKNRVTETTDMRHYTAVGVTAAVQGLYRVTPSTSLFLEPRFEYLTALNRGVGYQQEMGGQMTDHLFTLNAGVRVTRPSAELRRQQSPLHFVPHFFAGTTVGGYRALASSKLQGGNLGVAGTVSAGYHFTPLHALKASYVPSFYHTQDANGRYRLTDYRLLYMLNFSHLYQGVGERQLDVYVQGGPSFSLLRGDARNTSLGGALGFSVQYHVNRHLSVVTEPVGQCYLRSGFLPGTISPVMARLRVELNLGVNYNF